MGFAFRLQSLLNWKRNLEEIAKMRWIQKKRQLTFEEDEIRQLMQRRVENEQKFNEKIEKSIKIGEYILYKTFEEESYNELVKRENQKKQTEKEVEEEKEKVMGLMKERKILEKLKEKKRKAYSDHMDQLEQKNMDEIVTRQCPSYFKLNPS